MMTRAEHGTDGQFVLHVEGLGVLDTEIELIVADGGFVILQQRVDRRGSARPDRTIHFTPEIGGIETDRKGFEQPEAGTDEELVETAITLVGTSHLRRLIVEGHGGGIVITDIRVWLHAESETHTREESQGSHDIVEATTLRIEFPSTLLEVRDLSGETAVEDHRDGVDGSVRGRVQGIDLVSLMETIAHTTHAFVEPDTLVGQVTQAILTVGGVRAALRKGRHCRQG